MTIEKILEVIKAEMKNLHDIALFYRADGDETNFYHYMVRHNELFSVIKMFENEEFALKMAKNYGVEV